MGTIRSFSGRATAVGAGVFWIGEEAAPVGEVYECRYIT